MGKVFNAVEYSRSVKLQLLCIRAAQAVASINSYLIEEEENVQSRWNASWEVIAQCCLGLKKWRVWAFYEIQPLDNSSEAWLEAHQLVVFHAAMNSPCFWDDFSYVEYDLLYPVLGLIEEIGELYGFGECVRDSNGLDRIPSKFDSGHDGGSNLLH